jgi:uncharacterized protein (DUF934 family)
MPNLIKDGRIVSADSEVPILSLEELNQGAASDGSAVGVVLEADQPPSTIEPALSSLALVAIKFPVFSDGRGFSYARELRDRGFTGEIRATGHIIRDQLYFLSRCGFNAFEFDDDVDLEQALASLDDFSDAYQADTGQADPLFRRR